MRKLVLVLAGLGLAGCTAVPAKYAESLPSSDPKYNTQECKDIRVKALDFDNKVGQRILVGAGAGLLLGPLGIPFAVAADMDREEARRAFAREIHMRCSSKPLPSNLVAAKREPPKPDRNSN